MAEKYAIQITYTDPEVYAAISAVPEGEERETYMATCLRIGVLALKSARGTVDEKAIQHASDRLIDQLGSALNQYFDPKTGLFQSRVAALTSDGGEIATLMKTHVAEAQRQYSTMPVAIQEVMQQAGNSITAQFSLDDPQSALSRLVRDLTASHGTLTGDLGNRMGAVMNEFSLDKPDSALSRLKAELNGQLVQLGVAQRDFQVEVSGLLAGLAAKKEAEAKSTTHGIVFEENVGNVLKALAQGDIVEDCGTTTGTIRNSKVGDFVVTIGADNIAAGAKIVVEAKESTSYTMTSTLAEADEAKRNRGADICLFIHSAKTSPVSELLTRQGNDIIVKWDADGDDLALRAGYLLAKALSVRTAVKTGAEAASFQAIDKSVEVVRKQIEGFSEITTSGETIQNGATKILNRARIMKAELEKQLEILGNEINLVRVA